MKHNLLFVCTGNICRSPLAHRVFEHLAKKASVDQLFFVESAGTHLWHTGEDADTRMRKTAAAHGIPFSHPSRALSSQDFHTYDYIYAMDHGHLAIMKALNKGTAKLELFRDHDPKGSGNVPDPYYGGMNGFEEVFTMVYRTCEALLNSFVSKNR